MKYIAYIRVSTEKQGKSGLGLEAQKEIIKHYVDETDIVAWYEEVHSGKDLNMLSELQKAKEICMREGYTLVIAKTDRLRNLKQAISLVEEMGNQVYFCNVGRNADKFMLNLFFVFAERERTETSIRTKAALKAKKEQGYKLGSPQNLTNKGRAKGAESNRLKAENSAENMRAKAFAVSLKDSNSSLSIIAHSLNNNGFKTRTGGDWSKATVSRLLSRN